MHRIVVLAPWSSGSTAVSGYISRAGAYDCPPHVMTSDSKTPNSHEPLELRELLASIVDEQSLEVNKEIAPLFSPWFKSYLSRVELKAREMNCECIVLKHPLLAFFLADLIRVSDTKFIKVTRDLKNIEQTRQRRNWSRNYGDWGARKIYSLIDFMQTELENKMLTLDFAEFKSSPQKRETLLEFCELMPDKTKKAHAENWLRR